MTTMLANAVIMVNATNLGANPETRASNVFQSSVTAPDAALRGMQEQAVLARKLEAAGIRVMLLEPSSESPDAVFPNNWFSTHRDGRIVFYPMEAPSRRRELIPDLAERLQGQGYVVSEVLDLTRHAEEKKFLEGTGSLVLDRENRVAYAAPSTRTDVVLLREWSERMDYQMHTFHASDNDCRPVYHTNVVMALGAGLALVCLEAVRDPEERRRLVLHLEAAGHELLEIGWDQACEFAGNQLFLQGRDGPVVALSARADRALCSEQKAVVDRHARRVVADIATIEHHGGGSVRCMLAEIFLPRKENKTNQARSVL